MAFSFNWAGLVAPQVNPIKDEVDLNAMGQALGKGLRGYRQRTAAAEYADAIDRYRKSAQGDNMADAQRVKEIQTEIQKLRNENAQIDSMLGQAGSQQVEVASVTRGPEATAAAEEYARQEAAYESFDPTNPKAYDPETIKAVQAFIGVPEGSIDGQWGKQSQGYYDKFRNYTFI